MMTGTTKRLLLTSVLFGAIGFVACSDDDKGGNGDATGGGTAMGGTAAKGGSGAKGGTSAKGGSSAAQGGATSAQGGATTTSAEGGASTTTAAGGASTAAGGASSAQGGASTAAGGSSASSSSSGGCGTTPGTYTETVSFASGLPTGWGFDGWHRTEGATVVHSTTGPAANPTLCAAGCAVITVPLWAGSSGSTHQLNYQQEFPTNDLKSMFGARVTFLAAVTSDHDVGINVQAYTQGAPAASYAWGSSAGANWATLKNKTDAFTPITISAVGNNGAYCASSTFRIGLQVIQTATIPAATTGAGGASSTGGSSSTSAAEGGSSSSTSAAEGGSSSSSSAAEGGASSTGGSAASGGSGGASSTTVAPVQVGTVTVYLSSLTVSYP